MTDQEVEGAGALGLSIKLLATAARTDAGIVASVLPTAVPADSPFGWTDGVTNRIEIDAEPLGTVRLAGRWGAATSSAVLGDLLAVARGQPSTWAGLPPAGAPAVAAIDGLDAARHWYAFVPPVRTSRCPRPSRKRLRCRSRRDCTAHGSRDAGRRTGGLRRDPAAGGRPDAVSRR